MHDRDVGGKERKEQGRYRRKESADLSEELIRAEDVGIKKVKHDPGLRPPEAVLQLLGSKDKRLVPLWVQLLLDGLGGLHALTAFPSTFQGILHSANQRASYNLKHAVILKNEIIKFGSVEEEEEEDGKEWVSSLNAYAVKMSGRESVQKISTLSLQNEVFISLPSVYVPGKCDAGAGPLRLQANESS